MTLNQITRIVYFLLGILRVASGLEGLIGSWSRGIINSIPFAVMLLLGLLQISYVRRAKASTHA